jgi:SAM-dependent methyltransferase
MIGSFFFMASRIKKKLSGVFTDSKDNVLDVGCGASPYYHRSIKGKILGFDMIGSDSVHVKGHAESLPFKDRSFDKVVSVNSFYYFNDPLSVSKDMARILKKNGKVAIVVPFFYPIHDVPDDKYRFTEHGLRSVFEKDFRIDKIETIGGIFNIPAILLHSMIKGMPLLFSGFLRKLARIIVLVLYPAYLVAQLLSILDFLDRTRRFPTYYFMVASKK